MIVFLTMRVRVKSANITRSLEIDDENILVGLAKHSIPINAYCGGRGVCKKCIIRYIENPPKPSDGEIELFGDDKINEGYRLACQHTFKDDDFIEVFESEVSFSHIEYDVCVEDESGYAAIDVGTTTISIAIVSNKEIKDAVHILNPLTPFGADVISRIAYSNAHSYQTLSKILNSAIDSIIHNMMDSLSLDKLKNIVVCANPTMLSFFLSINPEPIGEYPYKPPFLGFKDAKWNNFDVYIPNVISAFIGSDITAGLLNVDMDKDFLFIDIGTNCEFVIKQNEKLFAASVPGGPALEGGGIDYGTIAKDGAIDGIYYDGSLKISTIGNKKANGIAGSGLISAIALLRRYGIIEQDGRLIEPWEAEDIPFSLINRIKKQGFMLEQDIYITQHSIREFQLVKASLNAGLKLLSESVNSDLSLVDCIYLAGGFTKSLKEADIVDSGLLSLNKEFIFLGNSSLNGGLKLFCSKNREKLNNISQRIEYIEIANQDNFQDYYVEYMDFR